jgi:hypothetical protein
MALDQALSYLKAGFSVVPVKADGSKGAAVSWAQYQGTKPSEGQVREWFSGSDKYGIAIICGEVSGGLEVIDFDQPNFFGPWAEIVEFSFPGLVDTLPVIQTPKGFGRHVYFKSRHCKPGLKLANQPGHEGRNANVAIEVRGSKQYVLAPGSPATCHPLKGEYKLISGPSIEETPLLDGDQREALLCAGRALDKVPKEYEGRRKREVIALRPGDEYSRADNWEDLLEEFEWTKIKEHNGSSLWRRPGKEQSGGSATLGHCMTDDGLRLFYVFSTNAEPFKADKAYSLFAAYSILKCKGDFRVAAQELCKQGFGTTEKAPDDLLQEVTEAIKEVQKTLAMDQKGQGVLDALLYNEPRFKASWELKRKEFDLNPNKYATSIIHYCLRVLLTPGQIAKAVFLHRKRHEDLFSNTEEPTAEWIANKIYWISVVAPTETEDRCITKSEADTIIKKGSLDILEEIQKRTGISNFAGLLKHGKHGSIYYIKIEEDGNERHVKIGPASSLCTRDAFRNPVIDQLNVVVPPTKKWEWEDIVVKLMLQVCEEIEFPDETEEVEAEEWIEDYLSNAPVHVGHRHKYAIIHRETFWKDGLLFIFARSFCKFINHRRKKEIAVQEVRAKLHMVGFRCKVVSVRPDETERKTTSRNYYCRKHRFEEKKELLISEIPDTLPEGFE